MLGQFSGNPRTEWLDEPGSDRSMKLLNEFWFDDPTGRRWLAPIGSILNGASIPEALWSVVGSPFTGDYRRASVVHDVACNNNAVDRQDADDMFYWGCLAGGCSKAQAKLLYIGVRLGTWSYSIGIARADLVSRPRFADLNTREELILRAKYTVIADRIASIDDFTAFKNKINEELNR